MNNFEIKQLIEVEFNRCETISQFKTEVLRLIDMCEVTVKKVDSPNITNPICTGQIKKQILPLQEKILNEKDPILREIYAEGYDRIERNHIEHSIYLIDEKNRYIKRIDMTDWDFCLASLTYRIGSNLGGLDHKWVSEADGSGVRLRGLIKREI